MLKIGHRGAKAYAPENTIASFRKALELKVDMVEFDVHITKDKHPVVIHDANLGRLTKKWERVNRLSLAQIKQHRIQGESIPTLAEVLEVIDSKVGINAELKVKNSAQIVVQTLRDYKVDFSNVMISSKIPSEVRAVERIEPTITTALVFPTQTLSFWSVLNFGTLLFWPVAKYYISWMVRQTRADYLSINHRFLSAKKLAMFKRKGIPTYVWTVNNPRKIKYLKDLGIDGIFSNYPDRL